MQPLEPGELVVEFRAGRRIAVRQVQAPDGDAGDSRFDIAAVEILWVAR